MNARKLLEKLKLDPDLFQSVKAEKMNLSQSIADHAGWVFRHIYSKSYLGKAIRQNEIAREHHGILHVGRATYYARVFANLYRQSGDDEALSLSEDDLKLIQIAMLFHDSARVNDETDDTDHESGLLLYFYLLELGVPQGKAKLLAEAVANKDAVDNKYKELKAENDDYTWAITTKPTKNIYQKIIHDSDCLDILRARDKFEMKRLDFFNDCICEDDKIANEIPFDELALIIAEARSVIHIQGDSRSNIKSEIKMKYENDNAFLKLCADITERDHPMLHALGKDGTLFTLQQSLKVIDNTPYDKNKDLTEANLNAALREGIMFARSVLAPSGLRMKIKSNGMEETQFRLELRKANRAKRNPARSVSMMGFGGGTYGNVGLVTIDPPLHSIRLASVTDLDSGRAKKKVHCDASSLPVDKKINQLTNLQNELKQGGVYTSTFGATHSEVICDLSRFEAIYYNDDPCTGNENLYGSAKVTHPQAPLLQAIYLQKEYEAVNKVILPIIYYSRYHPRVVIEKSYTDQEIINIWREVCEARIASELRRGNYAVLNYSSEKIKIESIYGDDHSYKRERMFIKELCPVDSCYSKEMRERISSMIKTLQLEAMKKHELVVSADLTADSPSVMDSNLYLYLIENRVFSEKFRDKIEKDIDDYLENKKNEAICCLAYAEKDEDRRVPRVPINSVYALAKACKSQNAINKLDILARQALDNPLKKISKDQRPDSCHDKKMDAKKVSNIVTFACDFDLYEEYKGKLIDLLQRFIGARNDSSVFSGDAWKNVRDILRYLIKLNKKALLVAIRSELMQILDYYSTLLLVHSDDIKEISSAYLELAHYLNVPHSKQKANLKNALSKSMQGSFDLKLNDDLFISIKKAGWLQDNEIFKYVVFHLSDKNYVYLKDNYEVGVQVYLPNVLELIAHLPRQQLTFTQRKILRDRLCKLGEEKGIHFFINLMNKFTFDSNIFLITEWQKIIITACQSFIASEPSAWQLPFMFALVEQLQQANIQHPDFAVLLEKKIQLENEWLKNNNISEKMKITLPLFTPLSNASITDRAKVYSDLTASNYLSILDKLNLDMLVLLLTELRAVNTPQACREVKHLYADMKQSAEAWRNLLCKVESQIKKQGQVENVNVDEFFVNKKAVKRPVPSSVSANTLAIPLELRIVEARLRSYIKDMEKYDDHFEHKFWFFAKSRAVNSKINYYLAKKLLLDLYTAIEKNEPFYVHDLTKVMVEREKIAKSITKDPSYAHARLFGSVNDIVKTAQLEKQKYRVKFT